MKRVLLGLLAVAVLVAGCSGKSHAARSQSITVYAAASLTEAFTTLAHRFEAAHPGSHVVLNFGASSTLATSIVNGAPADVFASAAPKNMATVVAAGEAAAPRNFVKNSMEIAAARGNPAHIAAVADLARPSVKVALCDPAVPCGAVAATVLRNAHVSVRPVSQEVDVKSTLAKVELGEVDAGIVYVTDVRAAGAKVVGVPIPDAVNASTDYPIAALKNAKNPGLAQAFVSYLSTADALSVLAAAGFAAP
ncbi:MAG: molybdate transport system substrate-binding protein [Pseudonocardiales bacterium]|jgi:molybdate transport system substrate-binding protein|nr:molybdate transport system substrate-binding protein [Pseudonocardiales bacterium]